MATYLDRDITGSGQDVLAGANLVYLTIHVITLGPEVRTPTLADPDELLRFGWFSLGDNIDVGDGARDYWRDAVWINFLNTLWTPIPSTGGGGPLVLAATLLRWRLSLGSVAHVHVFGL